MAKKEQKPVRWDILIDDVEIDSIKVISANDHSGKPVVIFQLEAYGHVLESPILDMPYDYTDEHLTIRKEFWFLKFKKMLLSVISGEPQESDAKSI